MKNIVNCFCQDTVMGVRRWGSAGAAHRRGAYRFHWGKVYPSAAKAVEDIPDNATLTVGGFGLCGIPGILTSFYFLSVITYHYVPTPQKP